jgi:small GTP-binding protein
MSSSPSPSPTGEAGFLFKIILTGESGVGKTNLLSQFVRQNFNANAKTTIGVECAIKTLQVDGQTIKVQLWDTAGQERFRAITSTYYRGAHGVLVLYDITNSPSFSNIRRWLTELEKFAEQDVVKMLIGNKSDLEEARSVTREEAQRLAEEEHLLFMETSAKTADNVNEAFMKLVTEILGAKSKATFTPAPTVTMPTGGIVVGKKEGGCC